MGAYPLMSGTDLAGCSLPAASRARLAISPPDGPNSIVALNVRHDAGPSEGPSAAGRHVFPPSPVTSTAVDRACTGEGDSLNFKRSRQDRALLRTGDPRFDRHLPARRVVRSRDGPGRSEPVAEGLDVGVGLIGGERQPHDPLDAVDREIPGDDQTDGPAMGAGEWSPLSPKASRPRSSPTPSGTDRSTLPGSPASPSAPSAVRNAAAILGATGQRNEVGNADAGPSDIRRSAGPPRRSRGRSGEQPSPVACALQHRGHLGRLERIDQFRQGEFAGLATPSSTSPQSFEVGGGGRLSLRNIFSTGVMGTASDLPSAWIGSVRGCAGLIGRHRGNHGRRGPG